MIQLLTNIGIVAGAIVGLGVIWAQGLKPIYRFSRRMEAMHDYIMVDLPQWQQKVDVGLKQLLPNGGSTILDKVNETNRSVADVKRMLEEHLHDRDMHNNTGSHPIVNVHMGTELERYYNPENRPHPSPDTNSDPQN